MEIPSATVANNTSVAFAVPFDATVEVTTDKLRLEITSSHCGTSPASRKWSSGWRRRRICRKFPARRSLRGRRRHPENLPQPERLQSRRAEALHRADPARRHALRRTARAGRGRRSRRVIRDHKGDFSSFDPPDDTREFVVEAGGLVSVPFRIGMWWLERVTYRTPSTS
ncbi:MAG: hypothetical protein U1G05_00770 [Kiritimatiellia bacterium]